MNNLSLGDYVVVTLADGTVLEGTVVKMGVDHMVLDECVAFGDWVFIEFMNIVDINKV